MNEEIASDSAASRRLKQKQLEDSSLNLVHPNEMNEEELEALGQMLQNTAFDEAQTWAGEDTPLYASPMDAINQAEI